jgi:hypothetical protein
MRGAASTARWYAECLGCRTAGTVPAIEPYVYASLIRDGVELMLLGRAEEDQPAAACRGRPTQRLGARKSRPAYDGFDGCPSRRDIAGIHASSHRRLFRFLGALMCR